jgi:hypothetical protein
MAERTRIPPDVVADVLTTCRRRCCNCYALRGDQSEKKGQVAHLDHDSSNKALENLAFLCLKHHDQYDSRTSQSKGLTIEELKLFRTELLAFVAQTMPPSDAGIVAALTVALDRPAFRTPFHHESSLPRFRKAIAETIETLNTGRTPQGVQLPSKAQIRDPGLRSKVEKIVEALVALRATFDSLLREGAIRHCGCGDPECPVYHFTEGSALDMDLRRQRILDLAHGLNPAVPRDFYDVR